MQKYTWFSHSIPHQNEAELTGFYFQSAGAISSKPLLELYRDRLQIICHFCWKPTTQEDQCCSIIKICGNTTDFYANIGTRCECSFSGWATHRFLKQLQFIKEKLMEWNQQVFGNIEAKKHSMLVMLDELDKKDGDAWMSDEEKSRRNEIKRELIDVSINEEISWDLWWNQERNLAILGKN